MGRNRKILSMVAGIALAAGTAHASVIGNPAQACAYLQQHALPGFIASKREAARLSGFRGKLFVDPARVIAHTGHIPGIPLLSSVPGARPCVAISPTLLGTSTARGGRTWLWLVGIAGTRHAHAYREAVTAANSPVLRHVAGWFGLGGGIAKRAVLDSECQATRWLGKPNVAVQQFQMVDPDLSGNRFLPLPARQKQEIVQCSRTR